jgi:hypothetical protein
VPMIALVLLWWGSGTSPCVSSAARRWLFRVRQTSIDVNGAVKIHRFPGYVCLKRRLWLSARRRRCLPNRMSPEFPLPALVSGYRWPCAISGGRGRLLPGGSPWITMCWLADGF